MLPSLIKFDIGAAQVVGLLKLSKSERFHSDCKRFIGNQIDIFDLHMDVWMTSRSL